MSAYLACRGIRNKLIKNLLRADFDFVRRFLTLYWISQLSAIFINTRYGLQSMDHQQSNPLLKCVMMYLWITQLVPDSAKFVLDSGNFAAWPTTCFNHLFFYSTIGKDWKKIALFRISRKTFFHTCCRLHFHTDWSFENTCQTVLRNTYNNFGKLAANINKNYIHATKTHMSWQALLICFH